MRDAISYLDKVAAYDTEISMKNTLEALGNYSYDTFFDLINAMIDCNDKVIYEIVEGSYSAGVDMKLFVDQFLSFLIDIAKFIVFNSMSVVDIPDFYVDKLKMSINFDNAGKYYRYVINNILDLKNMIKNDSNIKSTVEVILVKISNCI